MQYGRCAVERCSSCMTVRHDTSTFYIFVDVTIERPWKKFWFCKSQSFNNWENDLKSFNSDLAFMLDSENNWIFIIVLMFNPEVIYRYILFLNIWIQYTLLVHILTSINPKCYEEKNHTTSLHKRRAKYRSSYLYNILKKLLCKVTALRHCQIFNLDSFYTIVILLWTFSLL